MAILALIFSLKKPPPHEQAAGDKKTVGIKKAENDGTAHNGEK
ncbi:MAG: hypothetical protein QXU99_07490 [Candidatus Bathyarchaeia archaeon]